MACDLAPAHIRAIAPYQPGKPIDELARELGLDPAGIVKLASNENPLGISPLAQSAIEEAIGDLALYPDGSGHVLKTALTRHWTLNASQFVLGNGSNDVLDIVARAFLQPGCSAVYSQYAFAVYPLVIQAAGAEGICVPAIDYGHDLPAMLAAIRSDTRMVFIANPNNPTGTLLSRASLLDFMRQVPPQVIVVLDEAYCEYLPAELQPDTLNWLSQFANLVVTRTFSKAYGLAGLRVGYAMAHADVADLMNRIRQPFNVNTLGLVAAAAALDDKAFIERSYAANRLGMQQMTQGLQLLGLEFIPSFGNFVTFRIGNATAMYRRLLEKGVIVRPIGAYGLPEHLRVSVGLASENHQFLQALESAMEEMQ